MGLWEYHDYDGDGSYEAFALIADGPNSFGIENIYFIDSSGYITNFGSRNGDYYENDNHYRTCEGKGFFWSDYGAYGSGHSTFLFSVKDGIPYALDLSDQIQGFYEENGVFYTTENEFLEEGGHLYPEIELVYDSGTQQFYKGERISDG